MPEEIMRMAVRARELWGVLRESDREMAGEMLRASIVLGSAALTLAHKRREQPAVS